MDAALGEEYSTIAREIVMDYDHSEADNLFDRVLSGTIFSFETNRRIFRGMIRIQDNDRWRAVFDRVLASSRWDLTEATVETYVARSFDYIVDYLLRRRESYPAALDPVGEINLKLAKRVRRLALRENFIARPETLVDLADDFFPLPQPGLTHWRDRLSSGREALP